MKEPSIKVGVVTDQTGALSFMGIANANVAKMVINDINAKGGLLGRQVDLYLEDSETTDSVAEAKATKLVQQDHVDVILGDIYSSTRQAIKGPAVVKGKRLYIYPEQYEGQECDPLIFCTGPVPAQQVEPLIPWLMQQTGAKKFYLPSADYIWPHTMNKKVRQVATANGGTIVGEEYFPLDHADYGKTIDKITSSGPTFRRSRHRFGDPVNRWLFIAYGVSAGRRLSWIGSPSYARSGGCVGSWRWPAGGIARVRRRPSGARAGRLA